MGVSVLRIKEKIGHIKMPLYYDITTTIYSVINSLQCFPMFLRYTTVNSAAIFKQISLVNLARVTAVYVSSLHLRQSTFLYDADKLKL